MKLQKVIVDAGPLVSFINKNDRFHEWAIAQFTIRMMIT